MCISLNKLLPNIDRNQFKLLIKQLQSISTYNNYFMNSVFISSKQNNLYSTI